MAALLAVPPSRGRLAPPLGICCADLWQWVCIIFLGLLEYLTERKSVELKAEKAKKT